MITPLERFFSTLKRLDSKNTESKSFVASKDSTKTMGSSLTQPFLTNFSGLRGSQDLLDPQESSQFVEFRESPVSRFWTYIFIAIFLFLTAYTKVSALDYPEIKISEKEMAISDIEVFKVSAKSNEKGVPFSAVVDFDDNDGFTQSSNLEVIVVELYKRAGESVKKGEPIVEINSNALSELYFFLQNTNSRFQIAKEVESKDKELLQQGVISQRAYQTSYLNMNELRLKINEIRSTFNAFGINPDNAKGTHGFLVRARGSGILSISPIQIGQKIPAFTPYIRITSPNNNFILLRIRVPQNRSGSIEQGFSVYDAEGKKIGNVSTVSNIIDKSTNTIRAVAKVESENFKVGEIVEVYVAGDIESGAVVIPDDCWIKYYDDYIAFVRTKDGFRPIAITILEERDAHSVVESKELKIGTPVARGSLVILKGIMMGLSGEESANAK